MATLAEEGVYEDTDDAIEFGLFQEELAHVVTEAMQQAQLAMSDDNSGSGGRLELPKPPKAPALPPGAESDDGPSEDAVLDYATYLGFSDPAGAERDLLYIARWALTAPVPDGWSVHLDEDGLEFFHNVVTGESQYEHPLDAHYTRLYNQKRSAGDRAFTRAAMDTSLEAGGLITSGGFAIGGKTRGAAAPWR